MSQEKILPFYRDENGHLHVNACCSESNSDPIRAGRLANAAKHGDMVAAAELARMEATAMLREVMEERIVRRWADNSLYCIGAGRYQLCDGSGLPIGGLIIAGSDQEAIDECILIARKGQ